jgi:phospholipase/carboxylesterase
MLVEVVDPARAQGLPVYLMHGALDWMFPVSVAREAHASLSAAGAQVVYREIENLSHTYPQEENPAILRLVGRVPTSYYLGVGRSKEL